MNQIEIIIDTSHTFIHSRQKNSTSDNNEFMTHGGFEKTFAIKNDFLLWREHCRSRWWRVAHWRLIKSYTTKALCIGSASNLEARPFKNWTSTFYIEGLLNSIFPFCSLLINTVILATLERLVDFFLLKLWTYDNWSKLF